MGLRNTATEWGWPARTLHWLIAIGISYLLYLGLTQSGMPRGDEKTAIRATHASWALIVLVLMTIRVVWRFVNETPAHPPGMPAWQRASATIVHGAIYAAVFVQLASGAMTVATNGNGLPFFGSVIPVPVAEDRDAHHFWEEMHEPAWCALVVLLGVQVLGARYIHFGRKNDVLRRMTVG